MTLALSRPKEGTAYEDEPNLGVQDGSTEDRETEDEQAHQEE